MNLHQQVTQRMYQDGFDHKANHGLWKLKHKLQKEEWESVKKFFRFYNHTNKNITNAKYFGWMTTEPVKVVLALKELEQLES